MASVHKDLLICVLYNDTFNSSECLMSNVWLMGKKLMGEGNIMFVLFRLATNQKVAFLNHDGFIAFFTDIFLQAAI